MKAGERQQIGDNVREERRERVRGKLDEINENRTTDRKKELPDESLELSGESDRLLPTSRRRGRGGEGGGCPKSPIVNDL